MAVACYAARWWVSAQSGSAISKQPLLQWSDSDSSLNNLVTEGRLTDTHERRSLLRSQDLNKV